MDEARILRSRLLDAGDDIDAGYSPPAEGTPTMIGRVFDGGSIPTANDHYFLVHPVEVDGTPCEGCAGTATADAATSVAVDVIGSRVPVPGDLLRCFRVGGRWVAESGGPPDTRCRVVFHVTFCFGPVAGATVTIYSNSARTAVVATGTTDSGGDVTLDIGAAGFYWFKATRAGSADFLGAAIMVCPSTFNITLQPAADGACSDCCLPGVDIPRTLFVTDGVGTTAIVFDDVTLRWYGVGTHTVAVLDSAAAIPCDTAASGTQQVAYSLNCSTDGFGVTSWNLRRYWNEARDRDAAWQYTADPPSGGTRCSTPFGPGITFGTGIIFPADDVDCAAFAISGSASLPPGVDPDVFGFHTPDPGGGSIACSA